MKVTSMVTRYSTISPFSTFPFKDSTSKPVMLRKVFAARFIPSLTASSKHHRLRGAVLERESREGRDCRIPRDHGGHLHSRLARLKCVINPGYAKADR